jgi:hypothetical protein
MRRHVSGRLLMRRGLLVVEIAPDQVVLYKDVPTDAWFSPYVSLLVTEGIPLCRQLNWTQPLAAGLVTLAWIRQANGDPVSADFRVAG